METAKADFGKIKPSLVPTQIIKDIAVIREYGVAKYHDPDNWKKVEMQRYVDACYRHWLEFVEDPNALDEESGLPHYKHCACNMAFICEMMSEFGQPSNTDGCIHREWFGDMDLHYCAIDKDICDDVTKCPRRIEEV